MRRNPLWLLALLAASCVDSATEPPEKAEFRPQYDHVEDFVPPAEIAVNNYSAIFAESGLETFYKGDMAIFNGGLSYGTSASTVHFVNTSNGYFDVRQAGLPVHTAQPHGLADHYSSTIMVEQPDQSLGPKSALGILTVRETFAFSSAPDDDYLIVKYSLTNTTATPISNLYVGYLADPDVHDYTINVANEYRLNVGFYDAANQAARVRVNGGTVQHAIVPLTQTVGTYRSWTNDGTSFPYRDPTTNEQWFGLLTGGITGATFAPADIRQYVGSAATVLQPGQTVVYAFALIGGENAADLTSNIVAARAKSVASGIMQPQAA